jgi:hypothetical protein
VVLLTDLVSTSCQKQGSTTYKKKPEHKAHLIDAAYSESKCAAFDSSSVHIVSDQQDQLFEKSIGKTDNNDQ